MSFSHAQAAFFSLVTSSRTSSFVSISQTPSLAKIIQTSSPVTVYWLISGSAVQPPLSLNLRSPRDRVIIIECILFSKNITTLAGQPPISGMHVPPRSLTALFSIGQFGVWSLVSWWGVILPSGPLLPMTALESPTCAQKRVEPCMMIVTAVVPESEASTPLLLLTSIFSTLWYAIRRA